MGMNDWYVSTGDEIIWHYIDDYKTEQADMKNDDGSYGSAGNASTWNKWLEAADETPGANSVQQQSPVRSTRSVKRLN